MRFANLSDGKKSAIALLVSVAFLTVVIELFSWWFVDFRWHITFAPFFSSRDAAVSTDPCEQSILDLQLGDIHDNSAGCTARDGVIEAGFVRYIHSSDPGARVLVTLGGSTTDGRIRYADGYTWPYWLSRISNDSEGPKFTVLNGGMGGFSSSRELRRLQRDVLYLENLPRVVISLNGINDMKDYDGALELIYPYYIQRQLQVINGGRIASGYSTLGGFLPNTMYLLDKAVDKLTRAATAVVEHRDSDTKFKLDPRFEKSLPKASFKTKAELWKFNVTMMKAISEAIGAKYLVFLQPTMGLTGENVNSMSASDLALFSTIGPEYAKNLNDTFEGIRIECAKLEYCVDISGLLIYDGEDLYHDPRHPNSKGNKIIAQRVFEEISARGY